MDNESDEIEGKVTIRDVAKVAGVSPSTVSRAFARPDRVSAATAKRIFAVADQLGYHSTPVETMPTRGLKGMIAIIVPDIANQFMSDMIRGVQHEAASHGVAMIVSESRESASWERTTFDRIVPYVDGVILASSRMPDAMIRKCAQTRPVVVANREVRGVDNVTCDLSQGVTQLVDHIVARGYTRVTYLDGPASSWSAGVRWNAMSRQLAAHGITARRIWPGSPTFEGGFAQAAKYLEDPTGMVVTHNDLMALGFIAAMRRQGYECPRDFGVAGFDNDAVGQIYSPSLTSVRMSQSLLAQRAARLLLGRINHQLCDEHLLHVPTSLVVRESTQRPSR